MGWFDDFIDDTGDWFDDRFNDAKGVVGSIWEETGGRVFDIIENQQKILGTAATDITGGAKDLLSGTGKGIENFGGGFGGAVGNFVDTLSNPIMILAVGAIAVMLVNKLA